MTIKSTAPATPALRLLAKLTERTRDNESPIKDKYFITKERTTNTYKHDELDIIPAYTVLQGEFAGDFGMYAIADIHGTLVKVKIALEELHKVDFGDIM